MEPPLSLPIYLQSHFGAGSLFLFSFQMRTVFQCRYPSFWCISDFHSMPHPLFCIDLCIIAVVHLNRVLNTHALRFSTYAPIRWYLLPTTRLHVDSAGYLKPQLNYTETKTRPAVGYDLDLGLACPIVSSHWGQLLLILFSAKHSCHKLKPGKRQRKPRSCACV